MERPNKDDPKYSLPQQSMNHYVFDLEIYCTRLEEHCSHLLAEKEFLIKTLTDAGKDPSIDNRKYIWSEKNQRYEYKE